MSKSLPLKQIWSRFRLPGAIELRLVSDHNPLAHNRQRFWFGLVSCLLGVVIEAVRLLMAVLLVVWFLSFLLAKNAQAADITIPRAALPHRAALIRAAHAEMGLDAPVALLAAQIHTESHWRAGITSSAGAQGLAQFMPATARWLPQVAPHTGEPLPFNPGWAVRALCAYDKYLLRQITGAARDCEHWAFALSAYNGGLGWVNRDRALAASRGYDRARYWEHTEMVNAGRNRAAFTENRNYPRRIFAVQHAYHAAGWGPVVSCD